MSKPQDVVNFRRRVKLALVEAFDNKCAICGQTFEAYVYDFHHINPLQKKFSISGEGITRSKAKIADEAKKCVMVCANCHRMIEHDSNEYSLISNFNEERFYNYIDELTGRNKEIRTEIREEIVKVNKSRKPEREILKQQIRSMPFLQIGRLYGVTDNSVRKWCKTYNLPSRVCDIKNISDEEWECI